MTTTPTLPIALTPTYVKWIKLCKLHYAPKYSPPSGAGWIECLKPLFEEIYGYSPDEHYDTFLDGMFNELMNIRKLIRENDEEHEMQIRHVFHQAFYKTSVRNYELPIERAIAELCGQIQANIVVKDGVERYSLEET